MMPPVSCVDFGNTVSVTGSKSPVTSAADEPIINPKLIKAEASVFLEDPIRHATTESEVQIEAAQAVPNLKRGLKSMTWNLDPTSSTPKDAVVASRAG
jgi:HEAT repeat protein